jgi:hypothetical protein
VAADEKTFSAIMGSSGPVIAFRPSAAAKARVADLLARNNAGTLSPAEASELDHYCQLEHIMRMAKARAAKYLPSQQSG